MAGIERALHKEPIVDSGIGEEVRHLESALSVGSQALISSAEVEGVQDDSEHEQVLLIAERTRETIGILQKIGRLDLPDSYDWRTLRLDFPRKDTLGELLRLKVIDRGMYDAEKVPPNAVIYANLLNKRDTKGLVTDEGQESALQIVHTELDAYAEQKKSEQK
jgi:hypothetical protein